MARVVISSGETMYSFFRALLIFATITTTLAVARADTLEDIKSKSLIVVGVKADYPPFGYRDRYGNIIGLEPDLAADIADRLGVKLELVPVAASNRIDYLQQGRVDLVIATMTDTPERREEVRIVDPDYYSSGMTVLAAKGSGLARWEDLRDRIVCGIDGAYYNEKVEQDFGARVLVFKGTAEAYIALKQNRCAAFVYDESALQGKLFEEDWKGYELPLEAIDPQPWGMAVRKNEERFADMLGWIIEQWHRDGTILELEKKYDIKPSTFAQKMHQRYQGD